MAAHSATFPLFGVGFEKFGDLQNFTEVHFKIPTACLQCRGRGAWGVLWRGNTQRCLKCREGLPDGPVVKTPPSNAGGRGLPCPRDPTCLL